MELAIRAAIPADYPAFVRLFGELGVPDPVPDVAHFEGQVMPAMLVAGDPVVGYTTWRCYGAAAHVVHLAVDPTARGRGIGRSLLERVRAAATAAGCTRWYLNVKRDNAPAIRLYERSGMSTLLESWALRIGWDAAGRLPHDAAEPVVIGPDDDAVIAARLGLEPGRAAFLCTRPEYVGVGVRDAGELAGFAAFAPKFPGASPFAVARPALAGALLAACRTHRRPEHDEIKLAIEGDRATAELLLASGAELTFELLRMGAPLGVP